MSWNLSGRNALVTGASGIIGKAVTNRLLSSGANVFITTRNTNPDITLNQLQNSFSFENNNNNNKIEIFPCDMKSEQSCEELVKKVVSHSKSIDLFIHCAGATMNKLSVRTTEQDLLEMYHINTIIPICLAKNVVRHGGMLNRKDGCCIALGSVVGVEGNSGQVAYAASKGGLVSAWKSLAKELGTSKNIRFNVVSPGLVESEMANTLSEEQKKKWIERTSLGRLITAEEVAETVIDVAKMKGVNGDVISIGCS